jgi:hypothetical protein
METSLNTSIVANTSGNFTTLHGSATYRDSSLLSGNNWVQPNALTYTAATSYMANSIN